MPRLYFSKKSLLISSLFPKVLVIGEQLSYEDERITILPASEVEDREYEMNVVVVLDEGFGIYQG